MRIRKNPLIVLTVVLATAASTVVCGQSAQIGPVDIQPIAVPGPPDGWDMSTRLMNRQSASIATLSGTGGGAQARFEGISASLYFNPATEEPLTGTVVLRADTLRSDDVALQAQLDAWLEPARYPAFIFQSTGSAQGADGALVEGNLFWRDQVVAVTSRWRALQPVAVGEDLRKSAELVASMSATVPGAPFPGGAIRLELTLPVVGYTSEFVENLLEQRGIDVAALTATNPTYPSGAGDLSDVAWYLMLAGRTEQALDVYRRSLDRSRSLNTYLRMSDGYVFDGQYDMAVGAYTALEPYNVGQPHGLELVKVLGGKRLDTRKVAEINRALAGR